MRDKSRVRAVGGQVIRHAARFYSIIPRGRCPEKRRPEFRPPHGVHQAEAEISRRRIETPNREAEKDERIGKEAQREAICAHPTVSAFPAVLPGVPIILDVLADARMLGEVGRQRHGVQHP